MSEFPTPSRRGFLTGAVAASVIPPLASPAAAQDVNRQFTVEQAGQSFTMKPFNYEGMTISEFYDYYAAESHMPLENSLQQKDTSIMFFYEDPDGLISLNILHDKPDDGSGGAVTFTWDGLPEDGTWVVKDDDNDFYSRTQQNWHWSDENTDGGSFRGGFSGSFNLTITPYFNEEAQKEPLTPGTIDEWQLLSGDPTNPTRHSLNLKDPVTVKSGGTVETMTLQASAQPQEVQAGEEITFDFKLASKYYQAISDAGIQVQTWSVPFDSKDITSKTPARGQWRSQNPMVEGAPLWIDSTLDEGEIQKPGLTFSVPPDAAPGDYTLTAGAWKNMLSFNRVKADSASATFNISSVLDGDLLSQKVGDSGVAKQIDQHSVLARVIPEQFDFGDRHLAQQAISGLTEAVENGEMDHQTANNALERLIIAERGALKTLQFAGKHTESGDGPATETIGFSERIANYVIQTAVSIMMDALMLGKQVGSVLPDFADDIVKIGGQNIGASDFIVDAFSYIIGKSINNEDARVETKAKAKSEARGLYDKIVNGAVTTASGLVNAVQTVVDTIVSTITDFIQATFETGTLDFVMNPSLGTVDAIQDIITGTGTYWGELTTLSNEFNPNKKPKKQSWSGSIDKAKTAKNKGVSRMREEMSDCGGWLDFFREHIFDFGIAENLMEIYNAVQDARGEPWYKWGDEVLGVLTNTVQAVIGLVFSVAGIIVNAGSALMAALVLQFAEEHHHAIVQSAINGANELPPEVIDVPDKSQTLPPWAKRLKDLS